MVQSRNLTVGLFNAGSLGSKDENFQVAVERYSPDILAINETWIRQGQDARAPVLPGYSFRHKPRPPELRSRGGGVGFYLKRGISVRTCSHPIVNDSVEQLWIKININSKSVIIGTAYRPPWLSLDVFLDALTESVMFFASNDFVILLGDWNVNFLNHNDSNVLRLNTFIQSINLTNYVLEPTHFTSHSETLIDYFCTDAPVSRVNIDHYPELGGHAMITVELKIKRQKPPLKRISFRPIKDIDIEYFNLVVSNLPWNDIASLPDVDNMVETFNRYLITLFDNFAPEKTEVIRDVSSPWLQVIFVT